MKRNPSPWIPIVTGVIGAVSGLVSLSLSLYVYSQQQPRFIIDIPSDFYPPYVSSMKSGIPGGGYIHDRRTGRLTIPCNLVNAGERSEVVRFLEADLFIGKKLVAKLERREPFSVGGKQVAHVELAFQYDAELATSNNGTLKVSMMTSLGRSHFEKGLIVYSM